MLPELVIHRSLMKYNEASFPAGKHPILVAEVSIHNRVNDLIRKLKLYAAIGIRYYIIIDIDVPHLGKTSFPDCPDLKAVNGSYT